MASVGTARPVGDQLELERFFAGIIMMVPDFGPGPDLSIPRRTQEPEAARLPCGSHGPGQVRVKCQRLSDSSRPGPATVTVSLGHWQPEVPP